MFMRQTSVFILIALFAALLLNGCGAGQVAPTETQTNGLPTPGRINPSDYQSAFVDQQAPHLLIPHLLIDVRTAQEFASGIIPGAINIPLQELEQRLNEVPQDQPVVLYCQSGNRSNQAFGILNNAGYTQIYDLGGISQWQSAGMPIQK